MAPLRRVREVRREGPRQSALYHQGETVIPRRRRRNGDRRWKGDLYGQVSPRVRAPPASIYRHGHSSSYYPHHHHQQQQQQQQQQHPSSSSSSSSVPSSGPNTTETDEKDVQSLDGWLPFPPSVPKPPRGEAKLSALQKRMNKLRTHVKLRASAKQFVTRKRAEKEERDRRDRNRSRKRAARKKLIQMLPPLAKIPLYPVSTKHSPRMKPFDGERRRKEAQSKQRKAKSHFWLPSKLHEAISPRMPLKAPPGFPLRAEAAAHLALPQTPFEHVGKSARIKPGVFYYSEWLLPKPLAPCHPLRLRSGMDDNTTSNNQNRDGSMATAGSRDNFPRGKQRRTRGRSGPVKGTRKHEPQHQGPPPAKWTYHERLIAEKVTRARRRAEAVKRYREEQRRQRAVREGRGVTWGDEEEGIDGNNGRREGKEGQKEVVTIILEGTKEEKKRIVLRHLAKQIRTGYVMDAKMSGVRAYFNDLDVDGDGNVSSYELQRSLMDKGLGLSLVQAGQFVHAMDVDRDGSISIAEFVRAVSDEEVHVRNIHTIATALQTRKELYGMTVRTIEEAFTVSDRDGDGKVSVEEFSAVIHRLGIGLKEQESQALLEALDINHDGELSFAEFCDALKSVGFSTSEEIIEEEKKEEKEEATSKEEENSDSDDDYRD